jgi:hypothetical protein
MVGAVFDVFRDADPHLSDVVVAGWLSRPNDSLVVEGGVPDRVDLRRVRFEVCPLVWLASGRDPELVFKLARQAAGPLAW